MKTACLLALAVLAASVAQAQRLNLSKPVYTREGAILCPVDAFKNPTEGHGLHDLRAMYATQNADERKRKALEQGCHVFRAGIKLLAVERDDASAILDFAGLHLLTKPEWVIIANNGPDDLMVARADELTNQVPTESD